VTDGNADSQFKELASLMAVMKASGKTFVQERETSNKNQNGSI
jgi:hypothetical protein